jgi:hypothetical protein
VVVLDIIALTAALVAIALAVIAVLRARTVEEAAARAVTRAEEAASNAASASHDATDALARASAARQDAATALDRATSASQAAAQASNRAGAASRDAERALEELGGLRASTHHAAATPAPDGEPTDVPQTADDEVDWELENVRGPIWVLRNIGSLVAHQTLVSDATQPPKYIRPDEVIPRDVSPGDHLQFRAAISRGGPPPRVRITWRLSETGEARSAEFTLLVP